MNSSLRVGVFGGSFDPPHEGHRYLASCAVAELSLDRLLIIPAGEAPHKPHIPGRPSPEQRLAMSRLAFSGLPCCEVSDRELLRPGKSYTVLTLRELSCELPGADLYLIMGSDMFFSVQNWFCAKEIFSLCTLAPAMRYGADTESALLAHAERLRTEFGARSRLLPIPARELSSTEVRSGVAEEDTRISPAVRRYISENRLYETSM